MKVFLDDERAAPDGWVQARWPEEVIALLQTGRVIELSLDHDLGDDEHGTGYDVLLWLEEQVLCNGFIPPRLHIHSANPAARKRMVTTVRIIQKGRRY